MLVLALDTSTAAVSAGVIRISENRTTAVAEHVTINPRGHGEYLAPMIQACLHDAGIEARHLDGIVAGTGPGPFTGLRVGLVTAAVMAETLGIPAYGVCSLDGLAITGTSLLVATDARRREVYWATYRGDRLDGPHVSRPADVPLNGLEAMTGAGARMYADVLGLPLIGNDHPSPTELAVRARDRILHAAPSDPLTPLYLRRPDAVEPGAPKAVRQ